MKIAFFTPTLRIGGYEKVVLNYANTLSEQYQVFVLCGKEEGKLKYSLSGEVQIVDFQVRARGVLKSLTKWLQNNKVDILYVPFIAFSIMAVLAKRISKSKVCIYSVQHGFEKKYPFLIEYMLGKLLCKADVLAAVSSSVADYDAERFGISRNRYYILDNPVINSKEEKVGESLEWLNKYSQKPVFVTAGRLARDKHIELAIYIVSELNKVEEVYLLILGDGPEKDKLKALAHELGLEEKICFAGFMNNPSKYLSQCVALLQMSEIESFGNVVVEALCENIPVITTDCGGPVEIIEKDKYGICIGSYCDKDVIKNGVEAALKIIHGEVVYTGLTEKAMKYDVQNLEKQFMEPYYEWIKKN